MPTVVSHSIERKARKARKTDFFFACFASFAFIVCVVAPARAQDRQSSPPHVRPENPELAALVHDAAERSPVIRGMLDQLEQSDVVVYLRFRTFASTGLDGHLVFLTAAAGKRYLLIELACVRVDSVRIATLGHELHHALEVAEAPSVVDTKTMAKLYTRIGMRTGGTEHAQTFETKGAQDTAARVRRDLSSTAIRSSNGS